VAGGDDLDRTLAFWRDVLVLETYARFDPPGIAFILIGGVRLFFAAGTPPATIYLDEPELLAFADAATGLIDVGRLNQFLQRISGRIRHIALRQVSPLAVPVMLEIGRESVPGEASETLLRETVEELIAEALSGHAARQA